jgi:rsbT co-antagonist protein RsbR
MSEELMIADTQVRERIAEILMVLSSITAGSPTERLSLDLPADDPFAVLYEGINEVVETLLSGQDHLARYQRELEERLHTIEQQRSAIRELSTPVIEVWDRVLCLRISGRDQERERNQADHEISFGTGSKALSGIL